ncbi:hypothetical protein GGE58_005062 [Rhizobium lentis]|nr:hypothetical protein [Rhizobium lentis]
MAARQAGVHVGMPAAKAQALFRGLMLVDADPATDAAALERITLWALTLYCPTVAVDGIDGIVMDTEGADHLQGGELPMVTKIANQFLARKLTPGVADTWGAAHACARAISRATVIVPLGETVRAVENCRYRFCAFRGRSSATFVRSAFQTIGELAHTPRAPLTLSPSTLQSGPLHSPRRGFVAPSRPDHRGQKRITDFMCKDPFDRPEEEYVAGD